MAPEVGETGECQMPSLEWAGEAEPRSGSAASASAHVAELGDVLARGNANMIKQAMSPAARIGRMGA